MNGVKWRWLIFFLKHHLDCHLSKNGDRTVPETSFVLLGPHPSTPFPDSLPWVPNNPNGFPPFPHSAVIHRNVPFYLGFRLASQSPSGLLESSPKGNKKFMLTSGPPAASLEYTSSCLSSSFDSGLCKFFTTCCQKPGRCPNPSLITLALFKQPGSTSK